VRQAEACVPIAKQSAYEGAILKEKNEEGQQRARRAAPATTARQKKYNGTLKERRTIAFDGMSTNCKIQPATKSASAQRHLKKNKGNAIVIMGTPIRVT